MKQVCFRMIVTITVAAAFSSLARAQNEPPFRRGQALERLEQFKKVRMMEVMNLDEQTSIRFFTRYNKHQEALREIRMKQTKVLQRVQDLRKSDASEAEFDKIIRELRGLEDEMNAAKAKYIDELSEVLSKRQLVEYLVFEWRFQQNLRDLLRDMPRQGGPMR